MSKPRSWEVSDQFWKLVEPLITVSQRDPNKTVRNYDAIRQSQVSMVEDQL